MQRWSMSGSWKSAAAAAAMSPYAGRNYPTRVFWGEQHIHTSWSGDATGGGTRVVPEDALRLARGEGIVSSTSREGQRRSIRPWWRD